MRSCLLVILILSIIFLGCSKEKFRSPEIQLGHVDIIIDNESYIKLTQDTFMTRYFAMTFYDTSEYGKQPTYDFFMIGQENFLHFSDTRGFYEKQTGGANLIFQTIKPGMLDSLKIAWKNYSTYALDDNSSSGPSHTLYELFPLLNWDRVEKPRLIPFLTTYSPESYRNWNLNTEGADMRTFLASQAGAGINRVLFKKINAVYLNATERENELLRAALMVSGYKEENGIFTHPSSAAIYINTIQDENINRFTKCRISLSSPFQYENKFGRLRISMKETECWLYYE
ncbi:MAG: hypothetical protein N2510_01205 [Ignavibacteria bacterium]|nr:hypothetical protein [Ignavibacteria bacterium]